MATPYPMTPRCEPESTSRPQPPGPKRRVALHLGHSERFRHGREPRAKPSKAFQGVNPSAERSSQALGAHFSWVHAVRHEVEGRDGQSESGLRSHKTHAHAGLRKPTSIKPEHMLEKMGCEHGKTSINLYK